MVRYWLILCGFVSTAYAYDPHLSIFANATPGRALNPGVSLEYANTFGTRTVIGSDIGITDPNSENQRAVLVALNGRLLYSAGLTSQWYPQASISWQSDLNQIDPWLGVGFQQEAIPEAGYFIEANWRTQSDRFRFKAGIRIWLDRFSSLDTRVRSSEPLGAVYRPSNKPVDAANTIQLENTGKLDNNKISVSAPVVVPAKTVPHTVTVTQSVGVEMLADAPQSSQVVLDSWYVHLGLFEQSDSMKGLDEDVRLASHRSNLTTWFDPTRASYRLLLGPYAKDQAQVMLVEMKRLKLDSFLFQKPQ